MREHPDHFITRLSLFSFENCKRAYYFHLAGLKQREIARLVSEGIPYYKNSQIREMIKAFGEALAFEEQIEARRKELNQKRKPYYDRHLDSWENEIITRCSRGKAGHWYAVLDTRCDSHCSLDFATCCGSRKDAIRMCSLKIRLDQLGIGRYAPHRIDFDMKWEWAKLWAKKETQRNYRQRQRAIS